MAAEPGATRVLSRKGRATSLRVRGVRLRERPPHGREKTHELGAMTIRIGTLTGNDLVLSDDAVSRLHCEIALDAEGFHLRDLGSTNGTTVDGYRAADVYLHAGARIGVGETVLIFEPLDVESEVPLSPEDFFGPLVGRSVPMRRLFAMLRRVASTESTVLIEGESGTGKELVARAIHESSTRAKGPFVVFDCGAVAGTLFESELFGHEKGAFTGATSLRIGSLEEADGGTLFLDEIGELPIEIQPKLLRALEHREVRRVGGNRAKRVDVRLIAATNRDLARAVNQGGFREDLYYRLAVMRLELPALRERVEDIPLLSEHILTSVLGDAASARDLLGTIGPENWQRLERHPWRGNVRELRNVLERTLALSGPNLGAGLESSAVGLHPVAEPPAPAEASAEPAGPDLSRPFLEQKAEVIARFEKEYVFAMLAKTNGNISRAAAAARIDRMYFKRLLRKHGG